MKKLLIGLFCLAYSASFAKTIEIPLTKKNSGNFYLYNAQVKNNFVRVAEGDSVYKTAPNSFFLNFEKNNPGNDSISENTVSYFKDSKFGKSSGLFYEPSNRIKFNFPAKFDYGMVLEFWIKPFGVESGTVLSASWPFPKGKNKSIEVYFKSGKIYFVFENVFLGSTITTKPRIIKISSDKFIPVRQWRHHRLTYNPSNGELNYYLDGELTAQAFATDNGQPDSTPMYLDNPPDWDYILGHGYRGMMDNFFLSADTKNTFEINKYEPQNSLVQTRVIQLKKFFSITGLEVISTMKKGTFINLQYRTSIEPFSDHTSEDVLKWQDYNLVNPQYNPLFKSKYIQFRINLFASSDGKKTPFVKAIKIKYDPIEAPAVPLNFEASSSEGKITVSLRENYNKNIKAYKIYYGSKKNNYWGSGAIQGSSPIIVPVSSFEAVPSESKIYYTLQGLEIFQVYFIRISALNEEGLEGELSEEISVRVRKLK